LIKRYAITLMGMAILIGVISVSLVSADTSYTIDFTGLDEGAIVSELSCGSGITCPGGNPGFAIAVMGHNPDLLPGDPNAAMIFDAECLPMGNAAGCSGGDADLFFPGHGETLIIAEDLNSSTNPDDANVVGAFLEFDFSAFGPGGVTVNSLDAGDIELNEGGAFVEGTDGPCIGIASGSDEMPLPFTGNHIIQLVALELSGVQCLRVHLNGSGTVDNIRFTVAEAPAPSINIEKKTNGEDADGANDADVPQIAVGDPITWTYVVSNTGNVPFAEADVAVEDDIIGAVTSIVAKGNGDAVLSPGETWTYQATGVALDLGDVPAGVTTVQGCNPGGTPDRPAYRNLGVVTAPGATAQDLSHYCNPPGASTALARITGGGWRVTGSDGVDVRSSGGFTLHCDITLSNNLQINWGQGNKWHINKFVDAAFCKDDPAYTPGPPDAPADTYFGLDVGRLNNKDGSVACFKFEDHGERSGDPDGPDQALIRIWEVGFDPGIRAEHLDDPGFDCLVRVSDPSTDSHTVLFVPESNIKGNYQFHEDQPHKNGKGR